MNTLDTFELFPGEEGISDATRRVVNSIRAWYNKLALDYKTINEIYTNSILKSQKSYNKSLEQVLQNTQANICPKDLLINTIKTQNKVINFIIDSLEEEARKQHRSGTMTILGDNYDYTKLPKESTDKIIDGVKAIYKASGITRDTISKQKRMVSFAEAGYRNMKDISSLVQTSQQELNIFKGMCERLVDVESPLLTIVVMFLLLPIPFIGPIAAIYFYFTRIKASSLYGFMETAYMELLGCYNEVAKMLKQIDKGFAMESLIDSGVESYFFNQYNDGDIEFNQTFGNITYNEQNRLWHSKDFFTPSQEYTQSNGKNTWTGTRIPEPIKENYQRLGKLFNTCFSKRHVFEGFLTTVSEAINAAQEKNNSFGTSCNPEFIVAGKDRRFTIQSIDFCHPKSTNTDSIIVTMTFNNRVFYAIFNEKLQMYSYIPKDPKIISSYPVKEMLTDINHTQEFTQLNFALGMEGFKSSNSGIHQKFNEELTSVIEGEYDQEDTDVVVNPVDDQVADVDIRIDLTPNREQQLLKAIHYECKQELASYGIEGLSHKVTSNNHNFEVMFNDLYTNLNKSIKYFNNTPKELFDNLVFQFNTDINNKESFLDSIHESSTNVFRAFNTLKQLAESSDITVNKTTNTELRTYTSNLVSSYNANFTSKEDIQYVANELSKTKLNVNISQIKYYTNKVMTKLSTKKYTSDKYLYVSNVLNEMNNTLVNLANVISQGERFISGISIHANS